MCCAPSRVRVASARGGGGGGSRSETARGWLVLLGCAEARLAGVLGGLGLRRGSAAAS